MKLKTLLEGFAWERKPGQPLPTLKDTASEDSQVISNSLMLKSGMILNIFSIGVVFILVSFLI